MDFLKRHYEKLLLLLMLVLFIVIMFSVIGKAQEARSITAAQLSIDEKVLTRNIVKTETATSDEFNVAKILTRGVSNWQPFGQREKFSAKGAVEGTFSDLVVSARISSCPHCKDLIFRYYFRNDVKCPACAQMLADVPARPKERRLVITENDLDGDGMPNSYENANKLNANDPSDQLADPDRDGFSNLFEYENNTDPNVASDHSPLWYRLRYITMDSVVLPIKLRAISTQNYKDKSRWIIQLSTPVFYRGRIVMDGGKPRENSETYALKDQIKIEDKLYTVADAEFNQRPVGKDRVVDLSTVTLRQVLPKDVKFKAELHELILKVDREVRSNDKRLVLEDVGDPITNESGIGDNGRRKYIIKVGQTLRLGNRATRYESYRLQRVDERSKKAFFERPDVTTGDATKDLKGKKIVVTRDSEIPEDLQVKKVRVKASSAGSYQNRR